MTAMDTESLIRPAAGHAAAVLELCADRYSGRGTPMLADHVDLSTGEPERWEGRVLSNLARQQHFLRVLVGLDALGESRFGDAAESWIGHALPAVADEGGLLHWGGHTTYALDEDAPLPGNHELKCVYPFYDYLHRVDPEATRRFVEAFWQRHIWDWSTLLFNRHGDYGPWDRSRVWEEAEFLAGPLPIVDQTALSFINTGSDLIYAAAELFRLQGEERALRWAANLVSRYDQIRHPRTGLGAYQFNHREPCRVRESFKPPLGDRPDVNEATVLTSGTIVTRGQRAALTFLNLYSQLAEDRGRAFLDVALRDLRALWEHSWDAASGCFHPVLYDGQRLREQDSEQRGYCPPAKLVKVPADGGALLTWARACRVTGDEDLLEMAAALAGAMGWTGDGGPVPLPAPGEKLPDPVSAVFGLLDLHEATGEPAYLEAAASLGQALAAERTRDGLLAEDPSAAGAASQDNVLALALLHCAAARDGRRHLVPPYYPGGNPWDPKIVVRTVGPRDRADA